MSPRGRRSLVALAALGAAAALGLARLLPHAETPLTATPEALARGERVFRARCLHCHADIPLARRVAGWTPERAYEVIGRLPQVTAAMPAFHGTDDERRALAVYLAALGSGGH